MNRITRAHLLLWLLTIITGFNYTIAKMVMPVYLPASTIIWIRMSITTLFFSMFILLAKRSFYIEKQDYLRLFFCGLFGVTLNQIFFYEGLSRTAPINASLMMAAIPVTVFILSAIFLKDKITWVRITGLVISASGAVMLLLHSKGTFTGLFIGDILVILNAISYGIFLVIARRLIMKYDSATIVFWIFLIGTILSFPYSFTHFTVPEWRMIPMQAWLALGFIIVFATILNYYLSLDVLKDVSPSISSIYVYIQPIIAAAVAIYFSSDALDMQKFMSSIAILAGVYMVSK
ncbi:MAG: DMT family transporter [Cytophagales bacterium]|nr:DMT family transporter [Cytophaga sp.]